MCIAVYKPAEQPFPSKRILENCFENNPDGAGFMYADKGQVFIRKGYMEFDDFYKSLQKSAYLRGEDLPYVLHFRISTQGGNRADCTHPFPLTSKMADLRKLKCCTDIGIAHNGIISLTSEQNKSKITYNDTMKFITDYLSLIISDQNFYKEKKRLKLIEKLSESKLAILTADGHCELIGDWINDKNIFYSNSSYNELPLIPTLYDKYGYWYDVYEKYYDSETGLYDFSQTNCPLFESLEEDYCEVCKSYPKCYWV